MLVEKPHSCVLSYLPGAACSAQLHGPASKVPQPQALTCGKEGGSSLSKTLLSCALGSPYPSAFSVCFPTTRLPSASGTVPPAALLLAARTARPSSEGMATIRGWGCDRYFKQLKILSISAGNWMFLFEHVIAHWINMSLLPCEGKLAFNMLL